MRYLAALLSTLLILSLFGCGGGSSSSTQGGGKATSRATITVRWPDRSRVVPAAANSLQISIMDGTTSLSSQLAVRPATGGTVTVSFDSLPVGNFAIAATAFPQADGTGTPLAAASAPLALLAGQTTTFSLTLASTIDHLEISAPASQIVSGATLALGVTAKDATGAVVLLTPGKLTWTSSQPATATVDTNGTVTGALSGSATITVLDTESNKSAQITLAVLVVVTVQPVTPTVTIGDTLPFTATVVGSTNTTVTWSVQEANGGTITPAGVYTASNQPGTFHIIATSAADPSRKSTTTVTVQAGSASGTIQ
jgi:hypothetical protein